MTRGDDLHLHTNLHTSHSIAIYIVHNRDRMGGPLLRSKMYVVCVSPLVVSWTSTDKIEAYHQNKVCMGKVSN